MTLRLRQLTFGYGSRIVLRDLSLDLAEHQCLALMGPSGVGKSSLLRTLGRWNDSQPDFWVNGQVELDGQSDLLLSDAQTVHRRLPMLAQKARLYSATVLDNVIAGTSEKLPAEPDARRLVARRLLQPLDLWRRFEPLLDVPVLQLSLAEHKRLLIARLMAYRPSCVLLDEPLRDIAIAEEADMRALIQRLREQCAVIMVTHNKVEAKAICDTVCLVSGDQLIETTVAQTFFRQPRTALGRAFLRSGSSWPSIEETPVLQTPASIPRYTRIPGEFHWIVKQRLAGMQKPGLLGHTAEELRGLRALGVHMIVHLTEAPLEPEALREADLKGLHCPITDMSVPTLSDAERLCQSVLQQLDAGQVVALHCKAGLGRTGTMLACILLFQGVSAMDAIDRLRMINRHYIQTDEQLDFIRRFERHSGAQAGAAFM